MRFVSREMTIDDDNSIYVGGLPYDTTEDALRRVFDLYGAVVAVKIINDREVGGKCYGFVTFTNPRSAIDAINDMNGRTIGGRVVRVNEVKTRGGRPNFNREHFRRDSERGMDWKRGRGRVRDYDHDTEHHQDRKSDRSRGLDRERERDHDHARDDDKKRDRFFGRDREMYWEENESEHNRSHDRDWEQDLDLDLDQGRETNRGNDKDMRRDKDKDKQSKNRNGSHSVDRHSRELSSNSSDYYRDQVKEQLEMSFQRRDMLQKEISQFEEKLQEKQQLVSDLQKKSLKLEDALANAKKFSSHQQMQLTKLHRCFLQVRDYNERLKSCEQELQGLVDSAMTEADVKDDAGMRDCALHEIVMA